MRPTALASRSLVLFTGLSLAGCHISIGHDHSMRVNGVELEAEHEEFVEVAGWGDEGLRLDCNAGDVRVVPSPDGRDGIQLTLHETTHGDAHARFENGEIVLHTASGQPAAIGDATVYISTAMPRLVVNTGMGDIDVGKVRLTGPASLSTGMGDVSIDGLSECGRVSVSTGMGDVEVERSKFQEINASSGMGDVELTSVTAGEGDLSTGMGDVDVLRSSFGNLDASTGLGSIDCTGTSYEKSNLDTGLGSVKTR